MTAATTCARCGASLLPHVAMCFDCDLAQSAALPPASVRRYRVVGPLKDPVKLAAALLRLAPAASQSQVDALFRQPVFDVRADLRPSEEARLRELLDECAARYFVAPDEALTSLRFEMNGRAGAKAATTLAIGGATAALGVPLVPFAAVAMLGLLVARAVRSVTLEIEASRAASAELLGVVAPSVLDEARVARSASDGDSLEAFRECLVSLLELAATVRRGAAHLVRPDLARADAAVARVARLAARVAALPVSPPASGHAPYRADADEAPARELAMAARELGSARDALASGDATVALATLDRLAEAMTHALDAGAARS